MVDPAARPLTGTVPETRERMTETNAPGAGEDTRALAGRILRGEPLPPEIPHLRILAGPGAGSTAALAPGLTLGRGAEAGCRVDDPAASRLHARVERRGAATVLLDLGSKNGLRLNGRRVRRPRRLRHGDRIALGATELLVVAPEREPRPVRARAAASRALPKALLAPALLAVAAALWLLG